MRPLLRDEQREPHRRVAALAREVVREGHQRAAHARPGALPGHRQQPELRGPRVERGHAHAADDAPVLARGGQLARGDEGAQILVGIRSRPRATARPCPRA